ncbi:MAG TPA: type II toxin-antitoxin system prevent-host-death family antitoxin [Chthonomonadaceae bacterium]|nr:type II toxin-antitoxin system prevent-host-death family antitoxin [Chthonomonadaceae bacterium]
MMRIDADEAMAQWEQMLDRVAAGAQITLTRQGVPVALLMPVQSSEKREIEAVIEEIKALRRGRTLGNRPLSEMIEEGRRF